MSDTRAALLRAVCADPADDTPRLVLADYLDDAGETERAEFIRLQIALAAGAVPDGEKPAAKAREEELAGRLAPQWANELPRASGVNWDIRPAGFVRGFPNGVRVQNGKAWRAHADAVFAAAPVTALSCGHTFTGVTGRPVLASPHLRNVVAFTAPLTDAAGAAGFADNPALAGRLRRLDMNAAVGAADLVAAALARAPGLRNLEHFHLGNVRAGGVAALAASPHLTRVNDLAFHASPVGDAGAEALADSPYLGAVACLMLNGAGVGDAGAAALARSTRLASVRELYLGSGCPITDAGAAAIAAAGGLPNLTDLHLWQSRVGAAGALALADFAERRGLRLLNLRSCPVPRDVAAEITRRLGARFAS